MSQRDPHPIDRRRLIGGALAAAGLVAGGLVVRNQITHPHRDKSQHPDGRFRRLTLACPHPSHDPVLALALHGGFLARYNLELSVLDGFASGQDALARLRPGGADIAIASALSWLPSLQAGLDARMICGLQSGSARLLVERKSDFKRIEDLHRHTIGVADARAGAQASADRLFFSVVMRRKGMNPNVDVNWVPVAPDQFGDALASGRIQAIAGHDPVIWQAREQLHLVELASSMTGSYAQRVSRVLGVRGGLLESDPAAPVALVLAFQEAARTVARHLDETASVLADQLPDMSLSSIQKMLAAEGHAVHPVGRELREQIAQYIDEMKLIGLVPDEQDSTALAKRFCATVLAP